MLSFSSKLFCLLLMLTAANAVQFPAFDENFEGGFNDPKRCHNSPNENFLADNENPAANPNAFPGGRPKHFKNWIGNNQEKGFPYIDQNDGFPGPNLGAASNGGGYGYNRNWGNRPSNQFPYAQPNGFIGTDPASMGYSWFSPRKLPLRCKFSTYTGGDACGLDNYFLYCGIDNPCLANSIDRQYLQVIGSPNNYVECDGTGNAVCRWCPPGTKWNQKSLNCERAPNVYNRNGLFGK